MLRDLDLYHSIIEDSYVPAAGVDQMQEWLTKLSQSPELLSNWQRKARAVSERYSEDHLATEWHRFYLEQAAKGLADE